MSELHHACGIAAVYFLPDRGDRAVGRSFQPRQVSRLIPRMLLDMQNRGQLSAGMTTYQPGRNQLLQTYKELGTVTEVFRLNHRGKAENLMEQYAGQAAIGHVRYATCGTDDHSYAQPFERHHLQKSKWFSFGFNGQLANYADLRNNLLADEDHHLSRATDTEVIMHEISRELSADNRMPLSQVMARISQRFDGAYCLAVVDALGQMMLARDPLGLRPLCYAVDGPLFAAASESVALLNLGFSPEQIETVLPGQAVTVRQGEVAVERFAQSDRTAHCFFEWIYFANMASTLDDRSVYLTRTALGEELARLETVVSPGDEDAIVVPVPDTAKAAADGMAYKLKIPSAEGLLRNRYAGRTFIEGGESRRNKVQTKYTPLREVLEGKRVLLVDDSIVRSTTMQELLGLLREVGKAREVHVRIACPPIVAPCFYGIDMSTINELFAPRFLQNGKNDSQVFGEMARDLGADSLRFLPVESVAYALKKDAGQLCQACITGKYPTECGSRLYQIALQEAASSTQSAARTYED